MLRADGIGAAHLIASVVFDGVAIWMLVPLVIPAFGCAAIALVAIPLRCRCVR